MKRDREKLKNEVAANTNAHLKHVLERICGFLPTAHEMLVPFSHEKVEVLILFPGYDAVMVDSFPVVGHRTPSVSVEGFQQR